MGNTLPEFAVVERRYASVGRRYRWLFLFVLGLVTAGVVGPAGSRTGAPSDESDPLSNAIVVSRLAEPALLDAARGSSFCPDGWEDLGTFDLTAYVLANEAEFASGGEVEAPCGLSATYFADFLFGQGVIMQGSGRARDGSIVHYAGNSCFELTPCPLTAIGRCAETGRTVAVDPAVIPLGSDLLIEGLGQRRAEDTGGWIRGHHIDVYYGEDRTYREAMALSRIDRRVCRRIATNSI